MNLVQLLNSFEKKLTAFDNAQKVKLYSLPILIGFFTVYNFVDLPKETKEPTQRVLEKNSIEYYKFLNDLEHFAQEHSLTILNIKQNGMKFSMNVKGSFSDILALTLFCESYQSVNAIHHFKLDFTESALNFYLEFEFNAHKVTPRNQESTNILLSKIHSPFNHPMVKNTNEQLTLRAIVNNEVLINNTWLKKGETILSFSITDIFIHHIVLHDKNQQERILYLRKE